MASFTDTVPQFNPYVQQQPIEAMLKVGTYKQDKYEEGIQKIQGYIDNVAGLDIMRGLDKEYLQSKLNELGNNLNKVAGGDFSNFQLVNSVSGMASQVIKDPVIQNAVGSTAWYKKQAELMENAIKEGKSSQANIYDFNEKVNKYLTSSKLTDKFSDRYTNYTDYQKKWTDVLGKLHSNLTQQDITSVMDADGNIDRTKLGAAMSRVKDEGVTATQIENAITATLTPDDLNQISIDGRYQFRGTGVPQLQQYYQKVYNSQIKELDSRITKLNGLANSSASNPALKNKALDTIKELEVKKVELESSLKTRFDDIAANPDQAKADIYKEGALLEFSNAFSWEHRTIEKMTNPELEAQHWEKTYGLQVQNAQLDRDKFGWSKYIDTENLNINKQKLDIEITKLYGSASGFTTYLGEGTDLKDPVTAMQMDANQADLEANTTIQDYAKAMGKTVAAAEEDYKDYLAGDKSKIDVTWRGRMDIVRDSRIKAINLNTAIANTKKEVDADPTIIAGKKAFDVALAAKQPLDITIGGITTRITPKELYDYIAKEKLEGGEGESGGGYLTMDTRNLNKKEQAIYNLLGGSRYGRDSDITSKNKNQEVITNVLNSYGDLFIKHHAFNTVYNTKLADKIRTKAGKYIPSVANINVSNKDGAVSRDNMEGIVGSALLRFTDPLGGTAGGSAELSNSDAIAAQNMLNSKEKDNIQFKKVIQGDKTYALMLLGSKQVLIPLTPIEASQLPKSKNELSQEEINVKNAQMLGGGNTNVTNNPEQSHFQTNKFTNVRSLSVTADLNSSKTPGSGLSYLNLNIKTPSGWKNLQLDDYPMDVNNATKLVGSLTDQDIKNYFLYDKKIPNSWKEEIKNLK